MNQGYTSSQIDHHEHQSQSIKLNKVFSLLLSKWYYYLIVLALTSSLAYLYIRYTLPTYRVDTSILINERRTAGLSEENLLLQGFGLQSGSQNLDNQIYILSSWPLISKTLERLDFNINYFYKDRIMSASFYPDYPIIVVPDSTGRVPYNLEFCLEGVSRDSFRLVVQKNDRFELDTLTVFGQDISFKNYSFYIMPQAGYYEQEESEKAIYFTFNSVDALIERYNYRLQTASVSRDGTIITLSLFGTNKNKEVDFLNTLVAVFMKSNLDKKNYEASRIIDFIDDQLIDISDSLMITEKRLQDFRSRNQVMNISAQGQQIIEQAMRLEEEKARLMLELNYYNYLTNYLSNEAAQEVAIAPASMGIDDPLLATLMQQLAEMQSEYYGGGVGEKNPLQAQLAIRIKNTKSSLSETLRGIIGANNMAIEENQQQIRSLNTRARGLPVTERQLLGIERKFNLNEVLYTFLLQKRAEAQIQKASNAPDIEVVSLARSHSKPIAPKTLLIYLLAVILGLGLPFITFVVKDAVNRKIVSEDDLKTRYNLPIAGYIPHSKNNHHDSILLDPTTIIAESFRGLRTRMQFLTKQTKSPIILVSSSMPGEGKTFVAWNLASIYSLAGKNTILLGFDLRKPRIFTSSKLDYKKGLSTYLIGKDKFSDIIQKTKYDHLSIIPAGPVPPNPAELISSERTKELLKDLQSIYDYIIIDSAPIGVVSDSFSLAESADVCLHIIRMGKTDKHILKFTLEDIQHMGISNLSFVVNDLKKSKMSYASAGRYGYTYRDKTSKHKPIAQVTKARVVSQK